MIAGMQIAEAISKFIGRGSYDPLTYDNGKLPLTMRQLIKGDFDKSEDEGNEDENNENKKDLKDHINSGIAFRYCGRIPIKPRQFKITRAPAPKALPEVDARTFYPLLSSFYEWLKKHKQTKGIDIDHTFDQQGWPLWMRFEREVIKQTGLSYTKFFPQEEWEMEEPVDWSIAFMPLYDWNSDENQVPLLEFLRDIKSVPNFRFPEDVYKVRDIKKIKIADKVFHSIIMKGTYSLLPEVWADAIQAVLKFDGDIAYYDYYESAFNFNTVDDIDVFFRMGKKVADMVKGTEALIDSCCENSEKFWDDFITTLIGLSDEIKKRD
jgi:hypothetical protein